MLWDFSVSIAFSNFYVVIWALFLLLLLLFLFFFFSFKVLWDFVLSIAFSNFLFMLWDFVVLIEYVGVSAVKYIMLYLYVWFKRHNIVVLSYWNKVLDFMFEFFCPRSITITWCCEINHFYLKWTTWLLPNDSPPQSNIVIYYKWACRILVMQCKEVKIISLHSIVHVRLILFARTHC